MQIKERPRFCFCKESSVGKRMVKIFLLQGIKYQNANKENDGQDLAFVGNQVPKRK